MKYFVIKHIPTGAYFPMSSNGGKRGSTYIQLPFLGVPRLFTTSRAAKLTLNWWLSGKAKSITDDDGDGRYSVGAEKGDGDPARKADEFEVVIVQIAED